MTAWKRPEALACSAIARVWAIEDRSPVSTPAAPGTRSAASRPRASLRACSITSWPSPTSCAADSLPSPSADPVTRTRLTALEEPLAQQRGQHVGGNIVGLALKRAPLAILNCVGDRANRCLGPGRAEATRRAQHRTGDRAQAPRRDLALVEKADVVGQGRRQGQEAGP